MGIKASNARHGRAATALLSTRYQLRDCVCSPLRRLELYAVSLQIWEGRDLSLPNLLQRTDRIDAHERCAPGDHICPGELERLPISDDGPAIVYQELTNSSHDNFDISQHLPAVLSSYKVWNSHPNTVSDDENLSVIRLYTSKIGYDQIFRIINEAFRTDDLTEQERRLCCAVFLIELLNIDLFNYTLRDRRTHNFQGTVYRGVVFSDDQLQDFKNLAVLPVAERYWAVPLAMMSASTDKEVALREFAGIDALMSDNTGTRHPFLWRIHVVELNPKYLQVYHDRFPSSVVSTICAVPIHELSDFAGEDEVLLRGPFFQLICLREEILEGRETPIHVMELIMLNANRDHPSTMELGREEGEKARQLFACLVGMWRAEVCKQLAALYNLMDDVEQYERIYRDEQAKFAGLVEQQ